MKTLILLVVFAGSLAAQTHSNVLSWSWTQGTGDPATGFIVQRAAPCNTTGCTGPGNFATISTSVTPTILTYTDTTVTSGQTWYYQVLAYNTGGNSLPSNIVSATTPFLPPTAPGTLQVISK